MAGPRAGADRGLVPAVSEPFDRLAGLRPRRRPVRDAAATARASTSPTGGRTAAPLNPCGDPPGGLGAALTPPTAEGGALRSQDLRTAGRPDRAQRSAPARRPDTGAALPDNPNAAQHDPNARRIIAYGLRNPFRFGVAARHERGLDRRRRLEQLGGDRPAPDTRRRPSRTSAGPATRAPDARAGTTPPTSTSARTSTRPGRGGTGAALRLEPRRARGPRARPAPQGARRPRASPSARRRQLPGRVPRRALLRRLLARLHLGDAARRERRCRTPRRSGRSRRAPPIRFDLQIGPGGDLFYADFDGGTIRRVSFTPANNPPLAVATANPTTGAAPADGPVRRHPARATRTRRFAHLRVGPRRRRPVRRLDRRLADVHLHGARASIRRASG